MWKIQKYDKGLEIGMNEVALNIMWYEAIRVGSDTLEYQLSRTDMSPVVQGNKYFIPLGFEMNHVLGRPNPVPKLQKSTRPNRSGNASHQTTFEHWQNKEFRIKYRMDKMVRDNALSRCSEWRL